MTPAPALLQIDDLHLVYDADRGMRHVLQGVNLTVGDGEVVGLVGESGSGKSVLLAAALRLLAPPWRVERGTVRFRGHDLLSLDERALDAIRGKSIGLALANPRQHLNPILPVGKQLAHVIQAHQPQQSSAAMRRAADLLRLFGIPDPLERLQSYPHELSGGMCQRVVLALAMANAPDLLVVDEPTSGLDVTISVQILDLLRDGVREFHSGLLIVSRDLGVVAHYCQRVAVMQHGRIVEDAPVRRFFDAPLHAYSRSLLRSAAAARDTALTEDADAAPTASRAPSSQPILEVSSLIKRFPVKHGRVLTAVNDVSFAIARGEALGLVGESGSGKTTVGRCILGLIAPSAGQIRFERQNITSLPGAEIRALRARVQMVFQDPFDSMDPRQRIGEAITEPLRLTTTLSARERALRVGEILDLVGLDASRTKLYPHQMSAGELQRVGIARALVTSPDLVVFDEPTSALDVSVRADILNLLRDLQRRLGVAYLFISHDLTAVRRLCDRVAILYLGKLVEVGATEALFDQPLHPYSRALLSSVLYPDPVQHRSPYTLQGEIPSPIDLPPGCSLHTRCPLATGHCASLTPSLDEKTPGRLLACLNVAGAVPPEAVRETAPEESSR